MYMCLCMFLVGILGLWTSMFGPGACLCGKNVVRKIAPKKRKITKKKTPVKKEKDVICLRCNRVGHASKDCYAKTKSAGTGIFNDILRKGLKKK